MPSYKSKCVVLKNYDLGEADRIVKLFSQDRGMIDSVAKGARKIKSKFGGRLELYNFIECELSKGKSLDIITQAEIIKNFKGISSDFNKFLFCQLISEIILKTHLAGAENAPAIFKLLYISFNEIDSVLTGDISLIQKTAVFFIARFLKLPGYAPLGVLCSRCGAKVEDGAVHGADLQSAIAHVFSIKHGGVLCRRCAASVQDYPDLKKPISTQKLDFLSKLFILPLKDFRQMQIDPSDLEDISIIIGDYIRYHTDCNIDMRVYLERVLP